MKKNQWAWLIPLLFVAMALRLFRLGAGSIWYDEGVSLYLAGLPIPDLVAHTAGDIHPPLYYILLHVWATLAGRSAFAAAFVSLAFSMVLIPLVFVVVRDLFDDATAQVACLLVALSPFHLWYAQEIRMYTLGATLGLLTLLALVRHGKSPWWLLVYVGSAALGLFTLYYMAFLLVVENLIAVTWWLRWRLAPTPVGNPGLDLPRWLAAQGGVLLLYVPWWPVAIRQATQPPVPPWRQFTGLGDIVRDTWTVLNLGQSVQVDRVWPVLLLSLVVCLVPFVAKTTRPAASLAALACLGPVILIALTSLVVPLFHPRYVFPYAPAFAALPAAGLVMLWRRQPTVGLLVGAVLILAGLRSAQAYFFDPRYVSDDHQGAVAYLQDHVRPGDALLINAGYAYPTFLYYYKGPIDWRGRLTQVADAPGPGRGLVVFQTGSIGSSPYLGWGSPTSDFYSISEEETLAALHAIAQRYPRLWVLRIYDTVTDPGGVVRRYLDDHLLLLDDVGFAGNSFMRIQLYRTHRSPQLEPPPIQYERSAIFGDSVRLLGYDLDTTRAPIILTTYWQAIRVPVVDLRAFVSMVDGQGYEWGHWDEIPAGSLYPSTRWAANEVIPQIWRLDLPVGTPPAAYTLRVGLYDATTGVRLSLSNGMGSEAILGPLTTPLLPSSRLPKDMARSIQLSEGIALAGYSMPPRLVRPGEAVDVTLYWRAERAGRDEVVTFAQIQDGLGKLWAAWEAPPAHGLRPSSQWTVGELIRDPVHLLLPADIPDGEYRVLAGLYRAVDKARLGPPIALGTMRVATHQHMFTPPPIQYSLAAQFGDGVYLLGYNLQQREVQAGSSVDVILYWQGVELMDRSYTVFVQILDPDNRLVGQSDAIPGMGIRPTTGWLPGEIIRDHHWLVIRPGAPPGMYRLVTGMYEAASGQRLPAWQDGIRQKDDMIQLTIMTVRP